MDNINIFNLPYIGSPPDSKECQVEDCCKEGTNTYAIEIKGERIHGLFRGYAYLCNEHKNLKLMPYYSVYNGICFIERVEVIQPEVEQLALPFD